MRKGIRRGFVRKRIERCCNIEHCRMNMREIKMSYVKDLNLQMNIINIVRMLTMRERERNVNELKNKNLKDYWDGCTRG